MHPDRGIAFEIYPRPPSRGTYSQSKGPTARMIWKALWATHPIPAFRDCIVMSLWLIYCQPLSSAFIGCNSASILEGTLVFIQPVSVAACCVLLSPPIWCYACFSSMP